MPGLFLSHTSVDKPFVEKLAKDLQRLGFSVWFDKWEIKVGESITWKIEQGLKENDYLLLILSPEAIDSEWVKTELSATWVRQMNSRKIAVLPILYRECDIPLFLKDRKYADFRNNYDDGLAELLTAFDVKNTESISKDNWRKFIGSGNKEWKHFREKEFQKFVTALVDLAKEYNWSWWVGGTKNPFSITFSAHIDREKSNYISIRLDKGKYMASYNKEWNPNRVKPSEYTTYVGNSIIECKIFLKQHMEDFKAKYGNPTEKHFGYTTRFINEKEKIQMINEMLQKMDWYQHPEK